MWRSISLLPMLSGADSVQIWSTRQGYEHVAQPLTTNQTQMHPSQHTIAILRRRASCSCASYAVALRHIIVVVALSCYCGCVKKSTETRRRTRGGEVCESLVGSANLVVCSRASASSCSLDCGGSTRQEKSQRGSGLWSWQPARLPNTDQADA